MKVSKKKFDFLAFTVEVWLTDSVLIGFILYFTGVL